MAQQNGIERDTIFAPATGVGRAAIAVIRISGPRADDALGRLTRAPLPHERQSVCRSLFDESNGNRIDDAVVTRMRGPRSYTGEDVVELSVHGGRAVAAHLLDTLARIPHFRLADAGEFTRRAVENGRLDLVQAEAIADLVNAETDAQRRQALRQMGGALTKLYEAWRERLVHAAAWLEATIDFADEEIPPDAFQMSQAELAAVASEIGLHLNDARRGEILRDGFHVAVVGPPNAGKSSLINALAQRDVAIVSETPGTTRDVLEVRLDLAGYPIVLADTAGLREPGDEIEREGVRRAHARAAAADLRLLLLDGTVDGSELLGNLIGGADLVAKNKADIAAKRDSGLWISAKTGEGVPQLIDALKRHAAERLTGDGPALTRVRPRRALEKAHAALLRAKDIPPARPELVAEAARIALAELGRITGRVDIDDVLDVVFRDFCIGK